MFFFFICLVFVAFIVVGYWATITDVIGAFYFAIFPYGSDPTVCGFIEINRIFIFVVAPIGKWIVLNEILSVFC